MDERITVNISEAAKMLGISRKFMYENLLCKKDFPLIRLGRKCLIPVEELRQWISEQRGA